MSVDNQPGREPRLNNKGSRLRRRLAAGAASLIGIPVTFTDSRRAKWQVNPEGKHEEVIEIHYRPKI